MREFKCLEGEAEIQCHVPYPYRNPGTVTTCRSCMAGKHSLLFLFQIAAGLWRQALERHLLQNASY
jgi:hypothetical protein